MCSRQSAIPDHVLEAGYRDHIDSDWYLMCPHEILTIKGICAGRCFYGEEWEEKYLDCVRDEPASASGSYR